MVNCDERTISDIVDGVHEPGAVIRDGDRGFVVPPLEERYADLKKASYYIFGRSQMSVVPLIASTGCPYSCDFCVDWNNPYRVRPTSDLVADLKFAGTYFPRQMVVFYDPNFGVNFDATLSAFEQIEPNNRNVYDRKLVIHSEGPSSEAIT